MHKLDRPASIPRGLAEAQAARCIDWEAFWHGKADRKEEVQAALLAMQDEKCAYCECKLGLHEGHIEHFRRKGKGWFPQLTFEWTNLYYSCRRNGTCGCHKDRVLVKSQLAQLVDPCADNPEDYLQFALDGHVCIREGISEMQSLRARLTIDAFNLNHEQLVQMRSNMIKGFKWREGKSAAEIDACLDGLPPSTPFLTTLSHYFGRRYK